MQPNPSFWKGRRVLLTGHTGFKGAWMALWLARLGARVTGLSLHPHTEPNLWALIGQGKLDDELIADIRDRDAVASAVACARPSVIVHLAAQSLVRPSYELPVETFATNLMGTVHLLEAMRGCDELAAGLIVTTDKVYANDESGRAFGESDPLGGHDPYSASKTCAEIAVVSYAASFFSNGGAGRIATARAGNVIGGGDWSTDRLVPDVWRASKQGVPVKLRYPHSSRPWQHVLEPLAGYLLYAEALAGSEPVPSALNFGPPGGATASVSMVAEIMGEALGMTKGWVQDDASAPHEKATLTIDPSRAIEALGWQPRLSCEDAVRWSAHWYMECERGADPLELCEQQIADYQALA